MVHYLKIEPVFYKGIDLLKTPLILAVVTLKIH